MTLYPWVQELVEKLTFIKKAEQKAGQIYFYYEKDGEEKKKRLSLRANRDMLLKKLEEIKIDINYYEKRKKIIKKSLERPEFGGFAFSENWDKEEHDKRKKSKNNSL